MKKILPIIAIVAALFTMSACSTASGPEAVAQKAVSALKKGDYKAYAATFNLSESDQQSLASMAEQKLSSLLEENGGIKSYKITDSEVNGDEATVTVHLTYQNGDEDDMEMSFVKVDGKWKQKLNK